MSGDELPPFEPSKGFTFTEPPNPTWNFGDAVEETEEGRKWKEGEKAGWTIVDPTKVDNRYLYGLLLSGIAPRPVAFVSTIAEDGTENLAPFSWFNQVVHYPPVLSLSIGTGRKDTAKNIEATKQFTINIISEPWLQQANVAAMNTPRNVSEWPLTGLTKRASTVVRPPLVAESAFSMECELFQAIDILTDQMSGALGALLVLGLIKKIHVRNDMLDERRVVDPGRLMPVARLGGITYGRVTEGYRITRKDWSLQGKSVMEALSAQGKAHKAIKEEEHAEEKKTEA